MSDTILFEVSDGLAHLTLNRPERLNAIDGDAAHRWRDLAREVAERDDIRAVLFDATGPAFCAGGDVAAMATTGGDGEVVAGLADVIHEGHSIFDATPKPIVAAVQGAVAGGGLGFMLVADYVVAGEAAFFRGEPFCAGLTAIHLMTGEVMTGPQVCVGQELADMLGEQPRDPTPDLAKCAGEPYTCEYSDELFGWDSTKCTPWPEGQVMTGGGEDTGAAQGRERTGDDVALGAHRDGLGLARARLGQGGGHQPRLGGGQGGTAGADPEAAHACGTPTSESTAAMVGCCRTSGGS